MLLIMTSLWYLPGLYVWVYQGCFWHYIRHAKCCLSWQAFDIYRGSTFEFIKVLSDTVDMINAAYHDKPLIFTGATFREKHRLTKPKSDLCMFPCSNSNPRHVPFYLIFVLTVWCWQMGFSRNVAPGKYQRLVMISSMSNTMSETTLINSNV